MRCHGCRCRRPYHCRSRCKLDRSACSGSKSRRNRIRRRTGPSGTVLGWLSNSTLAFLRHPFGQASGCGLVAQLSADCRCRKSSSGSCLYKLDLLVRASNACDHYCFALRAVSAPPNAPMYTCSQRVFAQGPRHQHASAIWLCGVQRRGRCRLREFLCLAALSSHSSPQIAVCSFSTMQSACHVSAPIVPSGFYSTRPSLPGFAVPEC